MTTPKQKIPRELVSILYGIYAHGADETAKSLGADGLAKQKMFLNDKRWSGARRIHIDEAVEQIAKILQKGI